MRKLLALCAVVMLVSTEAGAAQKASHANDRATVLLFISTECPYSNRYAPEIRRLYQKFATEGVRFWLVYPNRADTPARIARHLKDYGYPDIVLRGGASEFIKAATPNVTPEAAVFDASHTLVYQGRIDDRFVELMIERPAPTTHDLEQALASVLAGRPVVPSRTPAVGCFIADMR